MNFISALLAIIAGSLSLLLGWYSYVKTKDYLNPILLITALYTTLYIGKFVYISVTGELVFSYNYREPFSNSALYFGLIYSFLSVALFAAGFFASNGSLPKIAFGRSTKQISSVVLTLSFFVSALAIFITFRGIPVSEILDSLNNRFELFSGQGYLLVLAGFYKISLFLWLMASKRTPSKVLLIVLILPALTFDGLSGSRGKMVFENLLPLAYILHAKKYVPLTPIKIFTIFLITISLSFAYRIYVRDTHYEFNKDMSTQELFVESLTKSSSSFYGGPEAPLLDTIVLLADKDDSLYFGSTLFAALTYPIPRSIFPEKPRGASATLTAEYFPDYYFPHNIEISFPASAELYANFGPAGVLVMLIIGLTCGFAYRSINKSPPLISLICILVTIRCVLLYRNDIFNNSIAVFGFFAIAYLVYRVNSIKLGR